MYHDVHCLESFFILFCEIKMGIGFNVFYGMGGICGVCWIHAFPLLILTHLVYLKYLFDLS